MVSRSKSDTVEVVLLGFSDCMDRLVTSQVGDKDVLVEVPGEVDVPLKLLLKHYMGFQYEFLPVVTVAHIGWVIVFFFIFAYGITCLNFQRR
ncbi:ABC transporter G family member 39-like [Actinidia eriantha]|uniref:ABC transporter G family member 39-like n=1 Tax=Actinidia eriantha TaxID=165200 RepID=UPI002584382E|nr:ABC transporter G family member 39-like [Actinidia eriantha]